jgi:SNF2 family DNA or RNA helicase
MPGKIDWDKQHNCLTLVPPTYPSTQVKEIGGKWDKDRRVWVLPPYRSYFEAAREMYPDLEQGRGIFDLLDDCDEWTAGPEVVTERRYPDLYPFQQAAVTRLLSSTKPGQLLALSPGLGKSPVSLIAASALNAERVLIIAPLSLLRNWETEQEKWLGSVRTTRTYRAGPVGGWCLTNYDTITAHTGKGKQAWWTFLKEYLKVKWDVVIVDESIMVKNRKTLRFEALKELRARASRIWELSGSPTSRYADDLWTQMVLIDPQAFPSYWRFASRYCYVRQGAWGWEINGTRESRDVVRDFSDIMLVKSQRDVLPDLPDFLYSVIPVELPAKQRKAVADLTSRFVTGLDTGEKVQVDYVLAQLTRLQQVTSNLCNLDGNVPMSGKAEALFDLMEGGSIEYPMLIWTQFVPGAEWLSSEIKSRFHQLRVGIVNGTRVKQNEETFESYKSGGLDVLVLALPVGKFGHTLTNTRTVVYYDKTFSADDYIQSLHRVKRIGLDHRPRLITLKAVGTTDQVIEDNLENKAFSIAKVSRADLSTLLKGLGKEVT